MRVTIRLKRIYEAAANDDGYRVLVDGMWPRGIAKRDAALHEWRKEVAPSKELRQWFGHDRQRWKQFCKDYRQELAQCDADTVARLREQAESDAGLTLLFAAKDTQCNNAVVFKQYLENGT